jgi:alpha-amylase
MKSVVCVILLTLVWSTAAQKNPHWLPGRTAIVHLFEWRWADIAAECEAFLGPRGFAGVQVSPPTENVIVPNRPWYERYQPISYGLTTRSGDQAAFADMVRRCSKVGVRIYVDLVVNHMNAHQGVGTGGSTADVAKRQWPAVPFNISDFNPPCDIQDYQDRVQVRNCSLVGLPDLNQGSVWVRARIVELMNKLLSLGVAGFRMDAVKHMWPGDLEAIYKSIDNLNTSFNFPVGSKPFIYQEVIDLGEEPIKK